MINQNKPQALTAEEIAAFEADPKNKSRGAVQVLDYDSDEAPDRPARFYVAKPGRVLLMAVAETQGKSMITANDMLLNGCVLAGDVAQLETDDALYFGLLKDVAELVEAKKKK